MSYFAANDVPKAALMEQSSVSISGISVDKWRNVERASGVSIRADTEMPPWGKFELEAPQLGAFPWTSSSESSQTEGYAWLGDACTVVLQWFGASSHSQLFGACMQVYGVLGGACAGH